jgi:hypothetical protein
LGGRRGLNQGQPTILTYPSSSLDRERMVEAIKSVGKLTREARIAMRTIDAARGGLDWTPDLGPLAKV